MRDSRKRIHLFSGREQGNKWSIYIYINRGGEVKSNFFSFRSKADVETYEHNLRKKYYRAHKDEERERKREWRVKNPMKNREYCRRRRDLNSIPLNQFFEGSVAHHLDKDHIVYIPEALHKSTWHSLKKPETMAKINDIALRYLESSK